MSNWWDADKIETPGGTEFWKADEVVSEAPQEEQEVVTSARGSEARADVEQEVISDRANNWRNRSIFKDKPGAGAGRGSADDPRRLDRAQESEWAKEVRGNLPTIDGNLQISAPEPKKPREYKSVLEGVRMTGGGFDEREAQKLSRRDYAEQAEREAGFASRGSQRMTEARQPILGDRQRFAEENPITAGFAQSAANTLTGTLNAPSVVAGLVNESLVQPLSRAVVGAAGGDERLLPGRVPNMPLVDDLRSIGSEYASQLSRKTPGQAWDDGDFGRWLMTQMSANSFSAAQSLGALFVPGAQATLLSSMGAVSAGNAYAEGDGAKASALKGLVEAGSEMLPLKAAEKIKDLVLTIPEPLRQKALADAGKRLLAAGTAVTTNSLVGALEETVAQVGGNAIDIGISGKNKSLFDEVDRAAIVGGTFGGGMSAPAVIETAMGPTSPEQRRALELARALNGGEFTADGIDSAVANTLRTEPGSSNLIDPAATTIGAPAMQAAEAERARVDGMIAKRDEIKTQVEAVKTEAIADIGRQETVDGAIAATTRAVNLDSNVLLDGALKAAGIDPNELQAIDNQALAAINNVAEPAADAAIQAPAPVVSTQPAAAPQPQQSTVVWTGRRGDGYATPDDAGRALNERQRLRPAYDWSVRQNPEGRYVLEGSLRPRDGVQAGVSAAGNTQVAPMGQNAPKAELGATDVSVQRQAPQGSVWAKSDDGSADGRMAAAVERLAVAAGNPGSIQLVSRAEAMRELDVRAKKDAQRLPAGAAAPDAESILNGIDDVGDAAATAFGWRPTLVKGLPNAFGVQFEGRTYLDIGVLASGNRYGDSIQNLAIQTIGHETTHALEKSGDPQDRADWQRLRDAVLANAKPGVVDARIKAEGNGTTYGENEVVADVSGNFWLEPQFWQRLYELDNGSTMRRIAYKFMKNAAKLLDAVKAKRMDNRNLIENIEQVREVAAQVWASKAKRGDSLFADQNQTVSKSQADRLPGVNAEVAPDPRNKEVAEKWGKLTEVDKLGITKEVMDRVATKVFDNMGLQGWSVEYTSGMFEGGINPSAILRAPANTSTELLGEVMRVFGYVLDQKGMVAFDESNTTSESQAGFVKVVLPEGLSTDKIDLIRKEIAARVPQAEGDTVRDGAIVYGNFSAYNDKIETLDDSQFKQAIEDAIAGIDVDGTFDVAGPFRFHSEYDQAYWDDAYDPKGREAYLEKTRYGSGDKQEALPGRDGVRRGLGGNLSRTWLDNLARDTDTRISRLVGDKQPRKAYGATPDARADRAGVEQPAQPRGGDRAGRPDAVRSGVSGVVAASVGGSGKDIRGAVHYGKVGQLNSLSGDRNGTGIRGAENARVAQAADPRIRQRVYFYLPVEGGIPQPESGLGQHVYKADLSNLYDINSQQMRLPADSNAMDSAILDAGYSGYFNEAQGTVVMFGSVPVSYQGTSDQFNKVMRQPKVAKPKNVTRTEGDMLVRKPEGQEVMEVIRAKQAGINEAAPSFEMSYGEARVLASESKAADAVFESLGGTFRFGDAAYSKADFDELGAFNLDISDDLENESLSFLDDKKTMKAIIQEELEAERRMAEKVRAAAVAAAPTQDEIEKAGYAPEKAFNLTGALVYDEAARKYEYAIPTFAKGIIRAVRARGANKETPDVTVEQSMHTTFVTKAPSPEIAERFINRQVAGAYLQSTGFDLADTYRKGTIQKIASTWKAISKHSGFFKLPARSGNLDFESVAKEMGAMKGYDITTEDLGYLTIVTMRKDGKQPFKAEYSFHGREIECCTMGLEGSGGLGTEFYAVLSQIAENAGKRFVPDAVLSGVNTYRRTEQAMSYALKSGRTDVLLPGPLTRVYGYNETPATQQDHDTNIARLAIAGMRNAEELFPDVRRLSYDPATDSFTDSRGQDAEAQVKAALADPEARAMGLGRSTLARAVLTSDIISGKLTAADVAGFEKPVAYSMADVGLDEPMAESWGDERGGMTPGLRRFMAGSKIVNEDGLPTVMYHGTGRDIQAFRAKQAGAIFVTYNPKFADDFAALSVDWMRANWREVLTPEQIEAAKKQAAAAIMADKSIKMSERKAMKQSIMDGTPTGAAEDAVAEAAANAMPSGENIIPVFVRATAPFDFRIPSMVEDVIYTLQDRQGVESGGEVEIQLVKEGGQRMKVSEDDLEMALRSGMWEYIESPEIQAVIRDDLAHDGFFVKENGQVNLAVYEPSQLKSVFNRGTYDLGDDRLSYSRAALDGYIDQRNKTMLVVSPASQMENDIKLAGEAISAALDEMGGGSKERLPVPLGRVPHVLTMLGASNQMMHIDTAIVRKVLMDKHSEDFAGVTPEQFVRALYQPALVLRGRAAGEFEIITSLTNKNGPIIAPIKTNTTLGARPNIRSSAVMSAYARKVVGAGDSILSRIKSGSLLYADPVLAQFALTGRGPAPTQGINAREAQFSSAPPGGAQPGDGDAIEFSAPSAGINALRAQFLRSPPAASRTDNVNQPDLSVKPLNPNFVGWDQVRRYIIDGISQRKVKDDVALMRWIGDRYKGDWSDAPSFSRAGRSAPVWSGDEPVAIVSAINARIAGLGAEVRLAATFADLPQNVQDAAQNAGVPVGEFRGVTMPGGKVHIVQSNHSNLADLEATIAHEVYGHVGLRALFGPAIYRRLNKLYLSLGSAKVRSLAEKYGLDSSGYFEMADALDVSPGQARRAGGKVEAQQGWLMEELLAHIAEKETGTLKQQALELVGQIRDWLRRSGFAELASLGMADIAFILKQGRMALEGQSGFGGVMDAPSFRRHGGGISYSQAAGYDIPAESFAYKARRKMQDYFIRARLVQEAIASQGGVVDETTDFYRAEELSHGRIGALLQDFADQQVQPLMEKAVEFGIELDELSLYAYAMHAKERNAYIATIDPKMQDGGSGMTNDEADSILDLVKLSGDQAKFDELHSDLMAITRGNRLAMLADGLITQDEFDKLEGAYDYYIPLRGFELMDEDGKPTGRSPGKGFNIRGPETLKAKGRRSRAGQLVENVIGDYQHTVVRGERNHVAKVFLNFVLSNPDDALWEIDATTTRKSLDRQTGRIARNTVIEKGEDTISVKIQGREIYIKIKDDLLLRAMRKTYTDETGEMANDLMRSVGLYSSLLRNTLTRYNPEFAVVNAMRDFGFGATAALDALGEKGAAKFVAHYAGAMAVSARNESKKLDASREWDKWFLEYKAAGGTTSGFYTKGLEEIGNDIRDMMIEAGAQPKDFSEKMRFNKATRGAKAALRVLEYAGSVSENAARVAAYRTAREMGKTPSQAASIAKNLTTNFDRKGEYGQILNALYLFYNAGIQGTQKTLQMFRNPKIMGYMAGVTAASVALALASATAGGDDPDDGMAYWDKIPAHVKERNIIIMLPPGVQVEGAEEVGTKGRYLTIPVQYGLNIFHVFGYQIADVIRNQRDKTRGVGFAKGGINMASAVAGSFNPFGGAVDLTNESSRIQAILPTVFDFPYQLVSGTNAFGRDVAPFKSPFDSKPDSQNSNVRQAGAPSEKVAQWLNSVTGGSAYEPGVIDISAGTVENLVRNLTGGTGMFIYDVLALTGKSVDAYTGGDPDLFVRDIPVVRRVLGETAGDVDQGLFYERRKAIQEARAIQKGAEEADAEITNPETLALASMNKDASKYTRWLSEIRKEMAEVKRDPELSDVERQTRIRELRAQRDSLTAEFNRNFMEVMREEFNSSAAR